MRNIYSVIIGLYGLSLQILSLVNQKARDWFYGRRHLFDKLEEVFGVHNAGENPAPVIWIHCASLGEYEQGKPVIQELKKRFPGFMVLLTFFSPSGFNHKADSSDADMVFYLPIDTKRNARRFVRLVSPAIAIFVKYEFWFNYLNELHTNKIPTYTISAIFRPNQHFFKWYGGWFRSHLRNLKQIFVQDEESEELLRMIDVTNVTVCGDTRFDRVSSILQQSEPIKELENFSQGSVVIVAGSTWPADEVLIQKLIENVSGIKIIIAPHEVTTAHLTELTKKFAGNYCLFSEILSTTSLQNSHVEEQKINANHIAIEKQVVIIDSIGLLSRIYSYGDIAFIGGGFGIGIHNTLEAAVYGIPVIFGPNYQRFKEARELIDYEAAVSISSAEELIAVINSFIASPKKLEAYSSSASRYVKKRTGATHVIMSELENFVTNEMGV
jgi:3-deoxy-D-manno-octulosonic-acid transferase